MKTLLFPLVIALATTVSPAMADDARQQTEAPVAPSIVAYAIPNTATLATAPNDEGVYGLRVIGLTTASSRDDGFFKLDFSHALNPMQMDAVYEREIQRVFHVTHSP